jgi:diguanylate cyclase (GGDEF)-like protein
MVDAALESFSRNRFRGLAFPGPLEERFEQATRKQRSRRMWFEGLIAILGFNICILLDCLLVNDRGWLAVVRHTAMVTPVALVINAIVRLDPPRWLREGSVAAGMFIICLIDLAAEGRATAPSTLFGGICVLITALFVGVVMRLRFRYALATLSAMFVAGCWSLGHSPALSLPEAMMADSMLAVGIVIILVAGLSLEFEERNGYILILQRNLQAEELAWANQALRELSNIDNLTRLPNRHALDERVTLVWELCAQRAEPVSAIIVDVDHFKRVNDAHGHLFGDEILRHIATLLPQALRSPEDMAARFGGEEFVLLLPAARPAVATAIAQQVRHLVESAASFTSPQPNNNKPISITVSCGVSTVLPGRQLQWNDLIAAADDALYLAKEGGRNRVEFSRCVEPYRLSESATENAHARPSRTSRSLSRQRLIAARTASHTRPISKSTAIA